MIENLRKLPTGFDIDIIQEQVDLHMISFDSNYFQELFFLGVGNKDFASFNIITRYITIHDFHLILVIFFSIL
jgi:hypothetical protein